MKPFGFSLFLLFFFICTSENVFAQRKTPKAPVIDTLSGEAFIRTVDQSLSLYYQELSKGLNYDSIIDALDYEAGTIPTFSDEVYCKRLAKMNEVSSFGFDCNATSLSMIKFFAQNRRNFVRVALGRGLLYFDMYEEKLSEYGLPLELKYLSVIESGLRPQVKSRAGALGLWQFMYATGKSYGLNENSYIDERMDPAKSTDAACRYLKKLHNIYGDWNLALAAYNAGPGNVNKAIKRSGGKRTYWEIRPFLPRETQGYVPNFIAASYLMTYHAEHNLLPVEPKIHYYQLDTICLRSGIHMQTIEKLVAWSIEDIQALNPVYKTSYIPSSTPNQCITGPLEKIGLLVSVEDSLYVLEQRIYGTGGRPYNPNESAVKETNNQLIVSNPTPIDIPKTKVITTVNYTYHKVKQGESLGSISAHYSVAIQELMDWNDLTSSRITVGQLLKIQLKVTKEVENEEYLEAVQDSIKNAQGTPVIQKPTPTPTATVQKKYYTIRSGDTFSRIASKYGITMTQLQKLNPGVSPSRIRAGQQIRVK